MSDASEPTTVHRSTNWAIEGMLRVNAPELNMIWLQILHWRSSPCRRPCYHLVTFWHSRLRFAAHTCVRALIVRVLLSVPSVISYPKILSKSNMAAFTIIDLISKISYSSRYVLNIRRQAMSSPLEIRHRALMYDVSWFQKWNFYWIWLTS